MGRNYLNVLKISQKIIQLGWLAISHRMNSATLPLTTQLLILPMLLPESFPFKNEKSIPVEGQDKQKAKIVLSRDLLNEKQITSFRPILMTDGEEGEEERGHSTQTLPWNEQTINLILFRCNDFSRWKLTTIEAIFCRSWTCLLSC